MSSSPDSEERYDNEKEPLNQEEKPVQKMGSYTGDDVKNSIVETLIFTTPIILGLILNSGMETITLHFLGQK